MAVAGLRANMCHFASYIKYFQKLIVYNIQAVGEKVYMHIVILCHLSFHYNILLILILASFFPVLTSF